ncbi:MAG TPA: DUF929 family protein [Thermoplasmata archaeon]|nr:DUF929 family protein [Thermoplasmata archaeon]
MVDWDRVDELRQNGEGWSEIAADAKVGFHPDASAGDPGRALRALYHRQRSRRERQGPAPVVKKRIGKEAERRWTLVRVGYLLVTAIGLWFLLAYVAPSPVGILVPAFPWLGLVLAGVAFLLIYALWKTREPRWSALFRSTVVVGVVLGLVFAGMVGLVGALVFGCPYLPPATAVGGVANATNWHGGNQLPAWQQNGKPVVYFFGAVWCPYCSASSWVIWKALSEYGTVSGAHTAYSYGHPEPDAQTPEMVLAHAQVASSHVTFQVSEYDGPADQVGPTPSGCIQLAYVTAYSGGSIPFVVIGGKYVHGQTTLIDPTLLKNYEGTGAKTVMGDLINETGAPWHDMADQTFWVMAMIAKCAGLSASSLPGTWNTATKTAVSNDLAQL